MVGEIRDNETASIAVNAVMAVHLVFSTFHANDVATTFSCLADMGIEPFPIALSIDVVTAQCITHHVDNGSDWRNDKRFWPPDWDYEHLNGSC